MAISVANLTSGQDTDGGSGSTTASVSPSSNKLLLLTIASRTGITANPNIPTATSTGLTWEQVNTIVFDSSSSSRRRVTVLRALAASPSAGAIAIDFGGQNQSDVGWSLEEFTGMDISGTNGSGAIVQSATNSDESGSATSITVTLAAFGSVDNATFGAFGTDEVISLTEGSGFTLLAKDNGTTTPIGYLTEFKSTNDTSVDMTSGAGMLVGGIGVEIKAAGGTDYTRSISDGITIADSRVKTLSFQRNIADTPSITDTTRRVLVGQRVLSDPLVISDSNQRLSSFVRSGQETITAVDSLAYLLSQIISVSLADSITIQDSSTRVIQMTREMADGIDLQDFITRIFSANVSISNTIGVSESVVQSMLLQRSLSDAQSVVDAISFQIVVPSNQDGGNAPIIQSIIIRPFEESQAVFALYDDHKIYDTHTPYYSAQSNDVSPTVLENNENLPSIGSIIISLSGDESGGEVYDNNKMYNSHTPYYSARSNDVSPTIKLE